MAWTNSFRTWLRDLVSLGQQGKQGGPRIWRQINYCGQTILVAYGIRAYISFWSSNPFMVVSDCFCYKYFSRLRCGWFFSIQAFKYFGVVGQNCLAVSARPRFMWLEACGKMRSDWFWHHKTPPNPGAATTSQTFNVTMLEGSMSATKKP